MHLDRRFADDVKVTISKLQKNPLHYKPRYRNVRVAYCDIFPYAVHFYMVESLRRIVIVAIVHQHRDPNYPANR
ncbi:MAG: type II toxin-antitoxin system RelE/ParE family toxin [Bacteroidetes bacterium]|nr:type II toxin-antitoxin system RelE/ParE family toxin [Bacteroidota bacterium]